MLGAAGLCRGIAEPREAADRQTLLRLIVEIVQELNKYHSGESKRPPPSGPQPFALGRADAADPGRYPEQRAGECAGRGGAAGARALARKWLCREETLLKDRSLSMVPKY